MKLDDLPLPATYWSRPEKEMRGDADPNDLYKAVGVSLSAWEALEDCFALMFDMFMGAGSSSPAALRVYGSIISAGGRRDALNEAANIFFPMWLLVKDKESDYEKYKKLVNHFGNASGRRNDIGHGIVINVRVVGKEQVGYFLIPPKYNSNRNKGTYGDEDTDKWAYFTGDYRYTAANIADFTMKFSILEACVNEYVKAIKWKYFHRSS